jgi:hypothetical protein
MLVAFLYWLLPDLMLGNPIDDVIVSLIAALSRFKKVSEGGLLNHTLLTPPIEGEGNQRGNPIIG